MARSTGRQTAQSLEAPVGLAPLRREFAPVASPGAAAARAFDLPSDALETSAPARGIDVFRLLVALAGIAAFLLLPAALIAGVVFLIWS